MRITNNIILQNASSNINGNKVNVDKSNNQMTTQQKIQRPSEDPVTAIRSLRLGTELSKVTQYYEKNIPDALSWMDVTDTALSNIEDCMKSIRTLCVQGSTGTLTQTDRQTILTQLQSLQQAVFNEGNADYAGRTVFTGYRTDQDLVFTENESNTSYQITQDLDLSDLDSYRYYNHTVDVPANKTEINNLGTGTGKLTEDSITINQTDFYRKSLNYDDITDVASLDFSYTDENGNTISSKFTLKNWVNTSDDSSKELTTNRYNTTSPSKAVTDAPDLGTTATGTYNTVNNGTSVTTPSVEYSYTYATNGSDGNTANGEKKISNNDNGSSVISVTSTDPTGTVTQKADSTAIPSAVYVFDTEEDWAGWCANHLSATTTDGTTSYKYVDKAPTDSSKVDSKAVPDDAVVLIKSTGDLVFGSKAAASVQSKNATVSVDYQKTGFDSGELRPEYYYDCQKLSDKGTPMDVKYARNDIDYDIQYTVAQDQVQTVNLEAHDVFDSSILQDINDMINSVQATIDAYDKVEKLKTMQEDENYQDDTTQANLSKWLSAAQKEFDYNSDNLDKLFSSELGNVDDYLSKIDLAQTKLGCMQDQVKVTQKRMDQQQETITDLKNDNDNLDLSTIIIQYTANYTAYKSSLQAAGKLGQTSLLDYI